MTRINRRTLLGSIAVAPLLATVGCNRTNRDTDRKLIAIITPSHDNPSSRRRPMPQPHALPNSATKCSSTAMTTTRTGNHS